MFKPFIYMLKELGIPVSFQYVMEFYQAIEKGMVTDINRLFLLSRLIFIKRVEHYDMFERAFAAYFLGKTDLLDIPYADSILESKPFQDWLNKAIEDGLLPADAVHNMSLEELLKKFWETALEQQEAHHGGNRWIGTGGTSPWGHSGRSRGGIRVHGQSRNQSAMKVIGEHRYVDYSLQSSLSSENIRQALATIKRMVPVGPATELNVDETISKTCKNGGEIEFVFDRELRDKIKVMLFLDNGGYSMTPYIKKVSLLFSKMRDQFKDLKFYYFHNCVYGGVYLDPYRRNFFKINDLLQKDRHTRLFIVSDADMGPSELFYSYGSINYSSQERIPGIEWLQLISDTFKYSVWLNPIQKNRWTYHSSTIEAVSQIFHMEDLTLNGLKNAVEYIKTQEP